LTTQLTTLLAPDDAAALGARRDALVQAGVGETLALRVASAPVLVAALDIAEVASLCERSLELVAGVYFQLDQQLHYGWVRERVGALPAETHWQRLARNALFADLTALKRNLTMRVLRLSPEQALPDALIEAWRADQQVPLDYYLRVLADQQGASAVDLSMLSVVLREMRRLGGS
jgi:glutamate dehydrogenase